MSYETWTSWRNNIYRGNSWDKLSPVQQLGAGAQGRGLSRAPGSSVSCLPPRGVNMAETGLLRRQSQLCLPPPRDKRAVFKAQNRHGLENKELKKISLPRWSQCAGVGSSFVTTVPRWWGVTIMGRLCHAGEGHKVNFILSPYFCCEPKTALQKEVY